jgi:CubicO group peptidase (beta-lactamase class C family)
MKNFILLFFVISISLFPHCQKELTAPDPGSFIWPQASPSSQGVNSQQLEVAFDEAGCKPFIHAIVVTRNGYLIAERYYNGTDKNDAHTIQSVSKSFLSALYGIALHAGHIATLDTPMVAYLSDSKSVIRDERIFDITLRHLLTMRAGYNGDSDILLDVMNSQNWVSAALAQQLIFIPGTSYRYSTVGTHLLSVILTKATGLSTRDYAEKHLFEPLGITLRDWRQDPQGYYFGGSDMFITPRDMARFGWLYMNEGNLDGLQIVPASWVAKSITPVYTYENPTWGTIDNIAYGYLWWLGEMKLYKTFFALGYGGQFIFNIPELNMVIATACDSQFMDWDAADAQEQMVTEIVANLILAAVEK